MSTFGESYANSYSKMAKEHKYKEKDDYKDKNAKRITKTITVSFIFRILMTRPVQPSQDMSNTCSLNAQTLPKVLGIKLIKWDNRQNVPTTFHNFPVHKCISWDILSPGRKWDILSDGTICHPKNAS